MPPKMSRKQTMGNMLHCVLQAIIDLHNVNGSTEKQIVRQIEAIYIASGKPRGKQLAKRIKNTLSYGVKQGVIVRKGQKYVLAAGVRSCRPIKRRPGAQKAGNKAAVAPAKKSGKEALKKDARRVRTPLKNKRGRRKATPAGAKNQQKMNNAPPKASISSLRSRTSNRRASRPAQRIKTDPDLPSIIDENYQDESYHHLHCTNPNCNCRQSHEMNPEDYQEM